MSATTASNDVTARRCKSISARVACQHVLGFDEDFVAAAFERWRVPA